MTLENKPTIKQSPKGIDAGQSPQTEDKVSVRRNRMGANLMRRNGFQDNIAEATKTEQIIGQ